MEMFQRANERWRLAGSALLDSLRSGSCIVVAADLCSAIKNSPADRGHSEVHTNQSDLPGKEGSSADTCIIRRRKEYVK